MQPPTAKMFRKTFGALLALSAAPILATVASAQTSWTAGTGDWYNGGNWSAGTPASGDAASILNGGTAQIATAAATAEAASLNVGTSGSSSAIAVSAGSLNVGGAVIVGGGSTTGRLTQSGGAVAFGSLRVATTGSYYRIDAGTLAVGGTLDLSGGWVQRPEFLHHGGDVSIGGNLSLGVAPQNNQAAYRLGENAGTLAITGNVVFNTATHNTFEMLGGTVSVDGTFGGTDGTGSPLTLALNGGSLTAANAHIGGRYNTATTNSTVQGGADVTVNGVMRVRGTHVDYQLNEGTLSIGRSGSLRLGGGDQYGAAAGTFSFNLNSTGPTTLTEHGTGTGASLILRDYGGAINQTRLSASIGTFRGWGTVGFTGTLNNSGKVIADGGGQERTLALSSFTTIANTYDNQQYETTPTGWFAVDGGKLLLPKVPVTGNTSVNWGEAATETTIDLVNSVRLTFHGVTSPGAVEIALLAADRSDIPGGFPTSAAWDINAVDGLVFESVDVTFRYDPDGFTRSFNLAQYTNGTWMPLNPLHDPLARTLTVTGLTGFSIFAIIPEPTSVVLFGLAGLALCRRRLATA